MHFEPGAPPPKRIRLWSLREDVAVEASPTDDHVIVFTRWGEIRLDHPAPAIKDCLRRMSFGPVSLPNVAGLEHADLTRLLDLLRCCVVHSLGLDDSAELLLSAVPISKRAAFVLPDIDGRHPIRLSRFAAMRTVDGELVLESPLAHHRVVLHRPVSAWIVGSLGRVTTVADLSPMLNMAQPLVAEIVNYLAAAGMVVIGNSENRSATPQFDEDTDPALSQWSHHDLTFHSRSRQGRHDGPTGAVFRHVDRLPPLPAVKPVPDGERFPLYQPVLADVAAADPSLTDVLESRRSYHRFSDGALSSDQLGELLFRTARVRSLKEASGAGGVSYVISDRPYPSSGGLYELELYLAVDRCVGLPRGIYHYDPEGHALTLINSSDTRLGELLDGAKVLTGTMQRPPLLITMTARMARLSWVYSGIAYSTALKHVGVLQQTLYLVATAMGLAPCALAVGDSEMTNHAYGLDWPAETAIGEFVIGLRPG